MNMPLLFSSWDYFESTCHCRLVFFHYQKVHDLFILCQLRAKVCHERQTFAMEGGYACHIKQGCAVKDTYLP